MSIACKRKTGESMENNIRSESGKKSGVGGVTGGG